MGRRVAIISSLFLCSSLAASLAGAQGIPLSLSGQTTIYADTDDNGCPGGADAGCSADFFGDVDNPIGALLAIACNQGAGDQIRGASGGQFFNFNVDNVTMSPPGGAATQTGGSTTDMENFVNGNTSFTNGNLLVTVNDRNGASQARVCFQDGPVVQVSPRSGPPLMRDLEPVNCDACPSSACNGGGTPNFLRASNVPLPSQSGGLTMGDIFLPITNNALVLGIGEDTIGELSLTLLNGCSRHAPAMADWSLMGLAVALLSVGTWLLGRRRGFAQAIPLR